MIDRGVLKMGSLSTQAIEDEHSHTDDKKPAHRLSQYSGYTNWGFGYDLFETLAIKYNIPLYFNRPYSMAFVLAKLLRWKRTDFFAKERFSVNLAPKAWFSRKPTPLCTSGWTIPVFPITINITRTR